MDWKGKEFGIISRWRSGLHRDKLSRYCESTWLLSRPGLSRGRRAVTRHTRAPVPACTCGALCTWSLHLSKVALLVSAWPTVSFLSEKKKKHGKGTFRTLLRLEIKAYSLRWMWFICRMYAKIGDGVFLFTDFDSISQAHGWLASHVDYICTKYEGATTLARLNVSAPKIVSSRSLSTTTTSKSRRAMDKETLKTRLFIPGSNVRGPIREENVLLA